jgi:hypothetical protein
MPPREPDRKVRYAVALFSQELLAEWVRQGFVMPPNSIHVEQGVPLDARFVTGWYDPHQQAFALVFEHPSFAEVSDNPYSWPVLDISFHVTYGEEKMVEPHAS